MNESKKFSSSYSGFSIIELLVVLVIVLMMSLAIFGVLSVSEGKKRTLTSVNDIGQAGNYAMYQIEKMARGAGSGFSGTGTWDGVAGCQLFATISGKQILPASGFAMAAPFNAISTGLTGNFRTLPIVIAQGMTTPNISGKPSDVLIVMEGTAGYGEVPIFFSAMASTSQLNLKHTISFNINDLVLVVDPYAGFGSPCMIEQVDSAFVGGAGITALPLAGNYYANPIGGQNITSFSTKSIAMGIGKAVSNMPIFQLIGVGNNNVLYQYDLLQGGTFNTTIPMADGVFELHALYGVETSVGGGKWGINWVSPGAAGFDYVTLEDGSQTSQDKLKSITAIRIGLIMRTSLPEKPTVPPATTGPLSLFSDLDPTLTYTRALSATEQNYRYRTIELTIPLRNTLLLN